jgi:uncharacterized oligopeptide transporter (OPT) family protein
MLDSATDQDSMRILATLAWALLYWLVFVPIALAKRAFVKNAQQKPESTTSYWSQCEPRYSDMKRQR